jgi:AcrR family transcriptional regulator
VARAVSTIPRKSASQKRSQATVEVLLDATARVLVREGYDHASTNRIATVAGVSIGSLYQYFPGKEALVTALVARHNREMLELLRSAMAAVATLSVAAAIRLLVAAMIDAHRVDPELHRIFDEQVPRMGQLAGIEAIEQEIFALVRAFFEARRDEIAVGDLDTATYICVTSVETLTHDFVIRRPEASASEQAAMVEEITRLLVGYLEPKARAVA